MPLSLYGQRSATTMRQGNDDLDRLLLGPFGGRERHDQAALEDPHEARTRELLAPIEADELGAAQVSAQPSTSEAASRASIAEAAGSSPTISSRRSAPIMGCGWAGLGCGPLSIVRTP